MPKSIENYLEKKNLELEKSNSDSESVHVHKKKKRKRHDEELNNGLSDLAQSVGKKLKQEILSDYEKKLIRTNLWYPCL